jgi:hypothetical protein
LLKLRVCSKNWQNDSPLHRGDLDLAVVNLLLHILGVLAVDGAFDTDAGAEDLLDGLSKLLGHGPRLHDLGDLNDVVEADVAGVCLMFLTFFLSLSGSLSTLMMSAVAEGTIETLA